MKKNIFNVSLKVVLGMLMVGVSFFIINGVVENVQIERKVNEFVARGVCGDIEERGGVKYQFCHVSRETSEVYNAFTEPSLVEKNGNYTIGSKGDILLRRTSTFTVPFVYEFITYFFGGHAAMVSENERSVYETSGVNVGANTFAREIGNNWFGQKKPVYAVRVKGADSEDIDKAIEKVKEKFGESYNYTFLFNTENTHYCTDLLSKSWEESNPDFTINDGFVTTVNDLLVSDKVYLTFYKYLDGNNVNKIYYLE